MEDRCHVERVRRDDVERREWARILVDERDRLAVVDRRDASLVAAGVRDVPERCDQQMVGLARRERLRVYPHPLGPAGIVVLGEVPVGDAPVLIESMCERVDAPLVVPGLPHDHDPHHLVPRR